jgi:hypothetical protein
MRFTCFERSNIPNPKSSTPALLLTHVSSRAPVWDSARIKCSGKPHKPKPPTHSVAPLLMSATAAEAEGKSLFTEWRAAERSIL